MDDISTLQGGLMLMLIGAAAAGARSAVNSGLRYCRRAVMVTAEIDSRDDAYRWVGPPCAHTHTQSNAHSAYDRLVTDIPLAS